VWAGVLEWRGVLERRSVLAAVRGAVGGRRLLCMPRGRPAGLAPALHRAPPRSAPTPSPHTTPHTTHHPLTYHPPTHPPHTQVMYLKGIAVIYNFNVFLYIFLVLSVLSIIFMSLRGPKQWKRKKVEDSYQY
jgi:hypothetical protein